MFKVFSSIPGRGRQGARLLAILSVIVLGISACQFNSSSSSIPTPTPTATLAEGGEPQEIATETPTPVASLMAPATDGSGSDDSDSSDVCSLISTTEAETALGQTVTSITPGTDEDSLTGETLDFCTYLGQDRAVVLSVVDTGSLDLVGPIIDQEVANMGDGEEVPTVLQVLGLGDQAFWATTSHAGEFIVQTGTVVFAVALGGNVGNPADYQDALRTLAELVAGRQ
jgi:hypothetical protein